jgi:hypothetical protein
MKKYLLIFLFAVILLLLILSIFCIPKEYYYNDVDVDAIVTWVDSTDPEWIKSYEYHTNKKFISTCRWTLNNNPEVELQTCLEMIKKNLPWIRNTYVLTASQRPKCLTDEILIYHNEIGLGKVFNSHAIESSLHKIPGLSENFIYFNDDIYVRKKLCIRDFITNSGKPLVYFNYEKNWTNEWEKFLFDTSTNLKLQYIIPTHVPYSLTISMFKDLEKKYPAEFEYTKKCKLRYNNEISPVYVAMLLGLDSKNSVKASNKLKVVHVEKIPPKKSKLWFIIKEAHIVCVNSFNGEKINLEELVN